MPSAPSPTEAVPGAFPAYAGHIPGFSYKLCSDLAFKEVFHLICIEISKTILVQNIEITWIYAPVCLCDALDTAYAPLLAGLRRITHEDADIVLKLADKRRPSFPPVPVPEIEKLCQKCSIQLRSKGILPLSRFLSKWIQTGDILLIHPVIPPELLVNLTDMFCCLPGHYSKNIVLHSVFFQQAD